jgi:hypothetical protein
MSSGGPRLRRGQIARTLGTLVSIGLLAYLLQRQGWREILEAVQRVPVGSLMIVLVLVVVSRVAVSARWYTLLRTTDGSIRYRESLRLTLAGMFAANFLPTTVGGDVVRAAGVLRISQDRVASAASIVVDRLIGMAGMLMILPIGLARLVAWLQVPSPGLGLLTVAALGLVGRPDLPGWHRWLDRGRRGVLRLAETWRTWLRRPSAVLGALGFTWLHMICLFTEIWLLLSGLGEGIGLTTIAGLWSLSYFITLIPVSINGLGLRELSVTYIFSEVGGVSVHGALTLALILRTLDMLVSLPGAFLVSGLITGRPTDRPMQA